MRTAARLLPAALLLPGGLSAQEAPRALSWDDCRALASRQNPDLLSAQRSVEAGSARYYGSLNGVLPRVSLTNSLSDSKGATGASRWDAAASASLDVLNLGTYARIGAASASLRRAEAGRRLASADLRRSLRRAWAELMFSQEQVAVSKRIEEIRRQNADLVSLKYDSGRESKGNMLRARAEMNEARAQAAQASRALRAARRELGRRLGLEGFEEIEASGALETSPLPPLPDAAARLAGHPALEQGEASVASARAALRESRSVLFPSLEARYTRDYEGRTYFPREPGWSASGVLSLPLFGGGPTAAYHDVAASRRDLEKAEEDLRSVRHRAGADLESSWAALAETIDQVEVQKGFLDAARQRDREASVRYTSGLMTFENWELVVADLVGSERGWLRARRDAVLAEADWHRALGLALEE